MISVTPVYDETTDSVMLICFLTLSDVIAATPTSCTVSVYDTTHTLKFTETSSSSTNGVFIISKNSPGFTSGAGYYCTVSIVNSGTTYSSVEVFVSLN